MEDGAVSASLLLIIRPTAPSELLERSLSPLQRVESNNMTSKQVLLPNKFGSNRLFKHRSDFNATLRLYCPLGAAFQAALRGE